MAKEASMSGVNVNLVQNDSAKPQGGGGHDINPKFPERELRTHGFISIALGFSFALTLCILFILFRLAATAPLGLENWVNHFWPNFFITFLVGFICGTLVAMIYNVLIFHRLNVFGADSNRD
jgi:hypothetical protein